MPVQESVIKPELLDTLCSSSTDTHPPHLIKLEYVLTFCARTLVIFKELRPSCDGTYLILFRLHHYADVYPDG